MLGVSSGSYGPALEQGYAQIQDHKVYEFVIVKVLLI